MERMKTGLMSACLILGAIFNSMAIADVADDKGLFKIDDIVVKLTLPDNWKESGSSSGALRFILSDEDPGTLAMLSINIFPKNDFFNEAYSESLLKELAETAKSDPSYQVLSEQVISFVGTKALDLVMDSTLVTSKITRTEVIAFVKGDRQIQIQFVAEKDKFETLLPGVKEGLKTFEVMPQGESIIIPQAIDSASYSLDARNQLKSVLEKIYLKIFTVAQSNNDERFLNETVGATLQEKSQNAVADLLVKYKNAFEVSETEAKAILNNSFDDTKNLLNIKDCYEKFKQARKPISMIIQYLLSKYQAHSSTSLELELTSRIFKEHLRQMAVP